MQACARRDFGIEHAACNQRRNTVDGGEILRAIGAPGLDIDYSRSAQKTDQGL